MSKSSELTSKFVQSAFLAFQGVDDIHSRDGLPLGVLGVSDSITDDIFQENFQDTAGLFVDQARDTFDTTTTSETTENEKPLSNLFIQFAPQNIGYFIRRNFRERKYREFCE